MIAKAPRMWFGSGRDYRERMPIYKIYRSGVQERRDRQILARWRWVMLVISALLLSTTVAMLLLAHK